MPSITIRDDLKAEIVSASPHLGSGFGKYFKGQSASLLAGTAVVGQLRKPLRLADPGETGLGLKWSDSMALGNDGPALTIDAGAKALIGVFNRPGKEIFENTFIGAPFKVPSGSGLVSFSISPSLSAGLKKKVGSLSFGFTASSETEIRYLHPFDLTGEELTLADACQTVLEQFVVPNTSDDLRQMRPLPPHAFACVSGQGQLQIAAAVNVAAAFNPLASVDTLPKLGKLEVTGAANATVGVKAALSGGYQIRVQKMEGARVRLSYHTTAGRGLEVSVAATAGLGVTLKDKDLLALFFSGPGGIPGAVKEDLVQGGITAKQLDRVAIALKAGLSRKIELAIAASLSLSKQEDAAFLYEIDLDALDATGAKALDSALAGDLSELNLLEDNASAHGIEVLTSKTQTLRKRKVSWRINLVGIVNVLSMRELVRTGSIVHDEESGEVVVTDKITNDHVGAISTSKQIRKLLYESTLMTLSYKAAGLDVNETMKIDQSFFFFDKSANRQRVSDYLDAVVALGLFDEANRREHLGSEDDFGKASLLLETSYDTAACRRLFEAAGGAPNEDVYQEIGRRAMRSLVRATDPDSYRLKPLEDPRLWKRMLDAGQPNFKFILPPPITSGSDQAVRVNVVSADYTVIVWWAKAMATAAKALAEMRAFLKERDAIDLDKDKTFQSLRREVEKKMADAIRKNTTAFDDPWGLVALFIAASGAATATASILSPKLTLFLPE